LETNHGGHGGISPRPFSIRPLRKCEIEHFSDKNTDVTFFYHGSLDINKRRQEFSHVKAYWALAIADVCLCFRMDSSNRQAEWVPGSSFWQAEYLDSTAILFKDGTTLEGTFQRASNIPVDLYEARYTQAALSGTFDLPALHDTITVRRIRGVPSDRTVVGEFLGFRINERSSKGAVRVRRAVDEESFDLPTIETIKDRRGHEWSGKSLVKKVSHGELPLDRSVALSAPRDTVLAVDDIDSVMIQKESSWRWIGLGIGAAFDVTAIVIAINTDWSAIDDGIVLDGPFWTR